jgi:hypothetical protein
MSNYQDLFEQYRKKVESTSNNYGNSVNFIGVTKDNPKIYIQILQNGLFAIPFYRWHEVFDGGKKRDFIARSFLGKPDFIHDHFHEDPKPRYVGRVLQLDRDGKDLKPMIEDITTSQEKADRVLSKFPDIEHSDDNGKVTFKNLYRIGFINVGKSVDDEVAGILEEFGDITSTPLSFSRKGEKLETSYSVIPAREAKLDADTLAASVLASATIDDYVDIFASEKRYNKAFNLNQDSESKAASEESVASKADEDDAESKTDSKQDIAAAINDLWKD